MSQDNNKPGKDEPEVNGTPVDLGSHNPDPNAHNWLHPEEDLDTWDHALDATEEAASPGNEEDTVEEAVTSLGLAPAPLPPPPADAPTGYAPLAHTGASGPTPENTGSRQRLIIGAIVAAVLLLIGVGIWLLMNVLSSNSTAQPAATEPAPLESSQSAGPLPREANAMEFQLGDCFADFDSESTKAKAVECDTGHSAQLVAVHRYPDDEAYPGRDALKVRAQDSCKNAKLNEKSNEYALTFQLVYPSNTSWEKGDRRVDCFVMVGTGNTIMHDLLQR
ncbi:septum formation family protein [Arthrobacter sp. ISL-30]|uniref:septum formation family protein n=1 Tax=Arthrobacter sp. ISL-30 TaxID=2819109 RepID=UPI001BE98B94|nr:septum formation family protein [Arthrobacter sp. ISL-30]MBT2512626.1 septum formation family protein [Arthrobacter sp. ISL-30]